MTITFELSHQVIRRTDSMILASGSKGYVTAQFDLITEDWTAPITALFNDYAVILDGENQCSVPWEVLANPGKVAVSAFCGDLHTATSVLVPVHPSGYIEGQTPQPPTPSIYQELTALAKEAMEKADDVQRRADAGEFDGDPGPIGPEGPKGQDGTVTFDELTEEQKESLKGKDGADGVDGKDGQDGKSAYAYAQEGGFTGTEAEFARKMAGEAALENLLDNSDFTHFIAQAGLGGSHGSDTYAGDRWILRNGSISGTKRSNGLGYTDIQISHTTGEYCDLVQLTPDYDQIAGESYTVALENADGKRYCGNFQVGAQAGPITLGDVKFYSTPTQHLIFRVSDQKTVSLRWLLVIPGTYSLDTLPNYVSKGYARELAQCMLYYENSWAGTSKESSTCNNFGYIYASTALDGRIGFQQLKRIIPTIKFYPSGGQSAWQIYNPGSGYINIPSDNIQALFRTGYKGFVVRITKPSADGSVWNTGSGVTLNGHWEACADL